MSDASSPTRRGPPKTGPAADRFDVVVVGARCAGAPLAALLADRGVRVALVERVRFPRDTLSTHLFEADALAFLDELGVAGELRATDAPFVARADIRVDDHRFVLRWPQRAGDIGGIASIRRLLLDPILARRAERAGAEIRMATEVTGLIERDGRIVGVRTASADGSSGRLRARLVIGADGRHSTVARLCGARAYNLTPNQRLLYWAFFERADLGTEPTFISHRWGSRFILAIPSDSGLYQVMVWPERSELERFRADPEVAFMDHARGCEPVVTALSGARRTGRFHGAVNWTGFFRQPAGRGWVLAGDAGHFKSPAPGRGIGDALLQAAALAPAVAAGLEGSDHELDRALARWGRWRDDEFAEHYWLAADLERAGELPAVLPEILAGLQRRGEAGLFFDLLNHRAKPSAVLTPPRVLGALGRVLTRRGASDRNAVVRQTVTLLAEDRRRRRLGRRPAYAPSSGAPGTRGRVERETLD